MKEKDGINAEDALAQLNNSRTSDTALISVYNKLNYSNFSNVQRTRFLKIVTQHISNDGANTDLLVAALNRAHAVVRADLPTSAIAASGSTYNFLEACCKILKNYSKNPNNLHIDMVSKVLEIISLVNAATSSKLFCEKGGSSLIEILNVCLKTKVLCLHALILLETSMTALSSSEDAAELIPVIYPMIFNMDDQAIRDVALKVLRGLNVPMKSQSYLNQLKEDTQNIYCKQMVEMVAKKLSWPEVWQFVVNMFGEELHSGGQLINHMLEVLERAFKHPDFEWTRVQAFECWKTLIDNFRNGLRNKKRIELIMIPLKANNHRIETLALAKLNTYNHLLVAIGKDLPTYPDILKCFFSFCFGSEKITCPPVKSYSALHEMCVKSINDVLMQPYIHDLFMKIHKEVIHAVGECFLMENVSNDLLCQLWSRLLELVSKQEGTEVVKILLNQLNNLVLQSSGAAVGCPEARHTPPSPKGPPQPVEHLGRKIVLVALTGLINGKFALQNSYLKSRSLYIGSSDVMNGTPILLFTEWLLTPTLMLKAGNTSEYKQLMSKLIVLRREEIAGFLDFVSIIMRKLLVFDDCLPSTDKTTLYQYTANVWCILVDELVEYRRKQGEFNQGNAAEPEFGALYSVLMFPVKHLYVSFDLIEKCCPSWKNLFYEACQSAELNVSSSAEQLCEQVCIRLVSVYKRNKCLKQLTPVFSFLSCILLASGKLKSTKTCRWVLLHVSGILRDFDDVLIDEELAFIQAVASVQHCLQPKIATREVLSNVSSTICSLLKAKVITYDPVDKLCALMSALKQAAVAVHQHSTSKESVSSMLQDVLLAGRVHTSQKVRSTIRELFDATDSKATPDKEAKSPVKKDTKTSSALSPASRSPKPVSKKFATIQMSPSNLSPGGTKRKLETKVCGSDGKFVRIETPPKKIILTEHQKEVRREQRQNIPALYQDLSQDTQSMSQDATQDVVALPVTPKGKSRVSMDEDAVMDVVDVDPAAQARFIKKTESPKPIRMGLSPSGPKKESFTPPSGFVLPVDVGSPKREPKVEQFSDVKQEAHLGKENENVSTPSKGEKMSSPKVALTRSNSSANLTTRSGKIVKRNSLAAESEIKTKRKYVRKSLPVNGFEDSSKTNIVDTVIIESDTTDTESVSSIASDTSGTSSNPGKGPIRRRRTLTRQKSSELDSSALDGEKASSGKINASKTGVVDPLPKKNNGTESPKVSDKTKTGHTPSMPKPVGGKVPTRTRSNSSLDEVVEPNRKDSNSPKSQAKAMSPIMEAKPSAAEVEEANCRQTSPKVSPVSEAKKNSKLNGSPGTQQTGVGKSGKRASSPNKCKGTDALIEVSSGKDAKVGDEVSMSIQTEEINENDVSSVTRSDSMESGNGFEDSQEIIESSQEHFSGIPIKECRVSLQQFQVVDLGEKTEINNVVVEKGPDNHSPFKVLPMESSSITTVARSPARRSLALDNIEGPGSPGAKSDLVLEGSSGRERGASTLDKDCGDANGVSKVISDPEERKEQVTIVNGDAAPQQRSNCLPDWMHEKKSSPPSKVSRVIRSARSHAFLKHTPDVELSSSPPKSMDVSPISSPVQSKRAPKNTDSSNNSTPIIKRGSRAAQLLGLGQAAAMRGGHTVVSNSPRSSRSDRIGDSSEEYDGSASGSNSSSTCTPSVSGSNSATSTAAAAVASPAIKRQGRILDLDSQKCTPQKSLEDGGLKEDWVPRTPCAKATPDTSILKRKREADTDAASPSVKRKRVSFRDPPLSSLLRFSETVDASGTVFSSDRSNLERTNETLTLEQRQEIHGSLEGNDRGQAMDALDSLSSKDAESVTSPSKKKHPLSPKKDKKEEQSEEIRATSPVKNPVSGHTDKDAAVVKMDEARSSPDRHSRKKSNQDKNLDGEEVCSNNEEKVDNSCSVEIGSEHTEGTQGTLDDLHRMPSLLSPIYPNLVRCTHPIDNISSKLTSSVWKKALLREFSDYEIRTVGDLAKLTEDRLDRLSVKPPRRTNVCCVLEDFENRHSSLNDGVRCVLSGSTPTSKDVSRLTMDSSTSTDEPIYSLKDVLVNATDEDIAATLDELGRNKSFFPTLTKRICPQEVVAVIESSQKILESLSVDLLAKLYISYACNSSGQVEKNMTSEELTSILSKVSDEVVQDTIFPSVPTSLSRAHSNQMRDYILRECPAEEIVNNLSRTKLQQLLEPVLQKHSPSEIFQFVDDQRVCQLLQPIFDKCSPAQFVNCLEKSKRRQLLAPVLENHSSSEIMECLDGEKVKLLLKPVVQDCSSSDIVQALDTSKVESVFESLVPKLNPEQLATQVLPKLSSSDIADQLNKVEAEKTIKALLRKFNLREGISIFYPDILKLKD